MKMATIGCVAKTIGISTDTVRLYERYGLIEKPARAENSYRYYTQEDIRRLRFIKRAKAMGFTLKEIHELIKIQDGSSRICDRVKERITSKLEHVLQQITELECLAKALEKLVRYCEDEGGEGQHCFILDILLDEEGPQIEKSSNLA